MKNKVGLSPIIGEILLVTLVVVLGVSYFVWTRGYSSDIGNEGGGEIDCANVKISIGDVCYQDSLVPNTQGGDKTKRIIKFNGRNDASEPELYGFLVYLDYGEKIIAVPSQAYSEITKFNSKTITTDFIEDKEGINQIKLIPKIKKDNKIINCEKREIIIPWKEEIC